MNSPAANFKDRWGKTVYRLAEVIDCWGWETDLMAAGKQRLLNKSLKSQLEWRERRAAARWERGDKEVIAFYRGLTLAGESPVEEQMTPASRGDAGLKYWDDSFRI